MYIVSDARPQIPSPRTVFLDDGCAKHICFQRRYTKTIRFELFFRWISVVFGKRPKTIAENHAMYFVSIAMPQIPSPKITYLDDDCAKHIMLSTPMRRNNTFCTICWSDVRRFWETAENHREKLYNLLRFWRKAQNS